jgi:AGZA family xanthine/uracil permease-like MFS transporter
MERFFRLSDNQTNVRTEILAGATTFVTMAYIIFVQPAVLSGKMFGADTGMDFGAVTTATCLSAALATAIMAVYARYPIAQAPGMGENFFFVFSAVPAAAAAGFANSWQVALGVVFVSGVLFLILSLIGLRELIFNSVSPTMKNGIATGIGLFTTAVLHARRVRGSILWGIMVATVLTCLGKIALPQMPSAISASHEVPGSMLMTRFEFARSLVALPPSLAPTFLQLTSCMRWVRRCCHSFLFFYSC